MTRWRPWQSAVKLGVDVVSNALPQACCLRALAWFSILIDVIHLHWLNYVLRGCPRYNTRYHIDKILSIHHQLTEGEVVWVMQVYVPLEDVLS